MPYNHRLFSLYSLLRAVGFCWLVVVGYNIGVGFGISTVNLPKDLPWAENNAVLLMVTVIAAIGMSFAPTLRGWFMPLVLGWGISMLQFFAEMQQKDAPGAGTMVVLWLSLMGIYVFYHGWKWVKREAQRYNERRAASFDTNHPARAAM